jgi:long-subunit acyl-CoA synthetase (AMP-forming)
MTQNAHSHPNQECPSLAHALHQTFHKHGPKPFIGDARELSSEYTWMTYDDVFRDTIILADSLRTKVGLAARSCVGICSENNTEWLITDFACCFNDYISVGLHTSWDADTLGFVLDNAEIKLIVSHVSQVPKFASTALPSTGLQSIIVLGADPAAYRDAERFLLQHKPALKVYNFDSLLSRDQPLEPLDSLQTITGAGSTYTSWFGLVNRLDDRVESQDEVHTLLFTSGTTGVPKGVAVPKLRWRVDAESNAFPSQEHPTVASYMSLAHGGDRGICWQACFAGARIGISRAESRAELLHDFGIIQPSFLLCMSHLWAEFYADYRKELESRLVSQLTASLWQKGIQRICDDADIDASRLVNSWDESMLEKLKKSDGWGIFVDASAELLGMRDMLLIEWFKRFGGNVFIPVTGEYHIL